MFAIFSGLLMKHLSRTRMQRMDALGDRVADAMVFHTARMATVRTIKTWKVTV
jgi:hypothetical protein